MERKDRYPVGYDHMGNGTCVLRSSEVEDWPRDHVASPRSLLRQKAENGSFDSVELAPMAM